jgi:DNA-binding protein H-NS
MATKESFADLQKRIRETEQELEEARQRAASMRGEELTAFVEEWLAKADSLGFTVVEVVGAIRPHFPEKGKRKGAKKTRADAGKKAEPKYRDPKTGETWSGRGRPAGWLKAYMDAGKRKEDFLIKK